jgi:hypothetical protein
VEVNVKMGCRTKTILLFKGAPGGRSRQTEGHFLLEPSEKMERQNRRNGNFYSIRPRKKRGKTDGMEIFTQSVGKMERKIQTDAQFYCNPSENREKISDG